MTFSLMTKCCYAEFLYAECHYAMCRGAKLSAFESFYSSAVKRHRINENKPKDPTFAPLPSRGKLKKKFLKR
jgi:hypothetical protein